MERVTAFRGSLLHCLRDPGFTPDASAMEYLEDGVLVVEDGRVAGLGDAGHILPQLGDSIRVEDFRGKLIIPGFIDCHVHYTQLGIIGSYGTQLLEWLETYTFPEERKFHEYAYACSQAEFFVEQLLNHGTTSAMVFATVHPESVDAIFEVAEARNMRLYSGKVLMDRNCPDDLRDSAETGYRQSRDLIQKWHGKGRLGYAITPRFAPTSTAAQLRRAGDLANEFPGVHIHTHLAENQAEVQWVADLFPEARSYLDVYRSFDLVRQGSVFAHCIHMDDEDLEVMASAGAAAAFCPTSNLFLGSGLFDLARVRSKDVNVGLGTDVGGGTTLNMTRTMADAYKAIQLGNASLSAFEAFYLATLGGAKALHAEDRIGNFEHGKEADFVVLDLQSTPIIEQRARSASTIDQQLFIQITMADDRAIGATYLMGKKAFG